MIEGSSVYFFVITLLKSIKSSEFLASNLISISIQFSATLLIISKTALTVSEIFSFTINYYNQYD